MTQPYLDGCGHHTANSGISFVDAEQLRENVTALDALGFQVHFHAIGDRAVASALDAFTFTQARGTIEHAQLVRHADLARFARLGVVASVQPEHAVDDRDLAADLWRGQQAIGYPLASLFAAGAPVRFGSDATVAPLDPWVTIAAAVHRTGDARAPWHPEERVSLDMALRASSRHGEAAIGLGAAADLVLCGLDPHAAGREQLQRMPVAATILAGRVTHRG
jgi:predicted amidohydrolase YtcJ